MATKVISRPGIPEAKRAVVSSVLKGQTVVQAMRAVGRTEKTYENWRRDDSEFASRIDAARGRKKDAKDAGVAAEKAGELDIDFATWRKRYLGYDTYPHQQQWIDVLEGKEPQPIEGCEYRKGDVRRIVINTPPNHAKTQTVTIDYTTYRICMDPNVRILLVSKRVDQAKKFLYQIKQRLTSPRFAALQADYAPADGWKPERGEGSYSSTSITINGRTRDDRDPTVEVLGLKGQIYGSRADLIILDDVVVGDNASRYEEQLEWLTGEVLSRLKDGRVLVVGTRLRPVDLYSEIINDERYNDGKSPWTYLRQPMVLDFAEDPKDWRTLWPYSTTPWDNYTERLDNGMYAAWPGEKCAITRSGVSASTWSMVYQQLGVSDDAAFKPEAVYGSMNRGRAPGPLRAGAMHHPSGGGDGMFTIASMDPAASEDTFVVVGKVDRTTKKRWIENAWVQKGASPLWIRDTIKRITVEYGVNEWVIETNAFQGFLVNDTELVRWLGNMGIKIMPHYTSRNKTDPEFGVASLSTLFGTLERTNGGAGRVTHMNDSLIQLPDSARSTGIHALCEQLITWEPGKRGSKLKMDGPMALWFWELRARIHLGVSFDNTEARKPGFARDRFMNDGDRSRQYAAPAGFFGGLSRVR